MQIEKEFNKKKLSSVAKAFAYKKISSSIMVTGNKNKILIIYNVYRWPKLFQLKY